MFKDLINESGWLTEKGRARLEASFSKVLNDLFSEAETDNQIRVIGSVVSCFVGEKVSDKIREIQENKDFLLSMDEDEFLSYLSNKYGDDFMLKASITREERERCTIIFAKKIEKAMKENDKIDIFRKYHYPPVY
jgi:hypothetical protein